MKKLTKILFLLGLFFVLATGQIKAVIRCDDQYGGVCREIKLEINKVVWDPENESYVNDLYLNDYKFAPGEEITFLLKVKNVGDEKFDKVYVKDYLPDYLQHFSGDLDFEINDFDPGETVEKVIKVQVVPADQFPDNSTICVVNTGEVWNEEESDQSTAQVCLEEKVLGVTTLPPTGIENWFIFLPFSLLAGLIGFGLKKINK